MIASKHQRSPLNMSSITVAVEGNRRKGDMSRGDLGQCALDIVTWFGRHTEEELEGAAEPGLQRLEKTLDGEIPDGLRALLEKTNGTIWYYEFRALSVQQIVGVLGDNEDASTWVSGILPFASDPDDNLLVVHPRHGAVFEWDASGGVGDERADSLDSFLEKFRDDLLSGHFEFVEECGVVEKATSRGSKK